MSRSRPQSAAIRLGPALAVLVFCALLGGIGLGYVGQKKNIQTLGETIAKHEMERERLAEIRRQYESTYHYLTSKDSLESLIRKHNLDLRQPSPSQVVTLDDRYSRSVPQSPRPTVSSSVNNRLVANRRY